MTAALTGGATAGYSLVLPPGWRQVVLDEHAGAAVRELARTAFADVPASVPPDTVAPLRRQLEQHLLAAVAAARAGGGTELYLPVQRMGDLIVPASMVVGTLDLTAEALRAGTGDDGGDVVTGVLTRWLAADERARAVELDGAPGLRREHTRAGRPGSQLGVEAASRRTEHVLAVPGAPGRWLTISCTVLEVADAPDLTDLLVELLDAVLTTFRWSPP